MKRRSAFPLAANSGPWRREAGLSLVELMVSITLGLMILSGVLLVFVNTSTARNEIERTSRQIENGRYAVEVIAGDLRLAGFYGEFDVAAAIAVPGAVPADPCTLSDTLLPLFVQGFDGVGFVSGTCALTSQKANTDVLVIRRARTCTADAAGCEAKKASLPYVQASLCADVLTTHKLGLANATAFDLKKKDCAASADVREYFVRIYYISTDNGSGVSVPTLTRLEFRLADPADAGSGGWFSTPLVEGIEEFNIEYGLDTDLVAGGIAGDGAPDVYVADPGNFPKGACAGACPVTNWMNVVSARFNVLARNLEPSPDFTDTKTYDLGKDIDGNQITVTPGLKFRRHIYSSLVRIVNAAGRRDVP